MCKYAKNDMFRVSTQEQMQVVAKVLSSKGSSRASADTPKFNADLWKKNTNAKNSIAKR